MVSISSSNLQFPLKSFIPLFPLQKTYMVDLAATQLFELLAALSANRQQKPYATVVQHNI